MSIYTTVNEWPHHLNYVAYMNKLLYVSSEQAD